MKTVLVQMTPSKNSPIKANVLRSSFGKEMQSQTPVKPSINMAGATIHMIASRCERSNAEKRASSTNSIKG